MLSEFSDIITILRCLFSNRGNTYDDKDNVSYLYKSFKSLIT